MTLGSRIDALHKMKVHQKTLKKELTDLKSQIREIEDLIMEDLDKQDITKSSGSSATVSISHATKPSVDDWDAFYAYIHRKKYYHLLDRRPSTLGCRELFETKGKIPGVKPVVVRGLNYTAKR